jgi:hypothetical protein
MFRFSIRELMLLTLVAAMGSGWWIECRHRPDWRSRAGAMKHYFELTGHAVRWEGGELTVEKRDRQLPFFAVSLNDFANTPDSSEPLNIASHSTLRSP